MAKEDDINLYIENLVQRAKLLQNILQSLPNFDQVMKMVEDGLKSNTGLDALVHELEPLRKNQEMVKKLKETMIPLSCNLQVEEIIYCREDLLEELTKISRKLKFLLFILKNQIVESTVAKKGKLIVQGIENLDHNLLTLNPSTAKRYGTHHLNLDLQIRDPFGPAVIRRINKSDQVLHQSVRKMMVNSMVSDAEDETQAVEDGMKRMHERMIDLHRINESINVANYDQDESMIMGLVDSTNTKKIVGRDELSLNGKSKFEIEQEYLYPTPTFASPSILAKKDETDDVNLDLSLSPWNPSKAKTSLEEERTKKELNRLGIEGESSSYPDPTRSALKTSTPKKDVFDGMEQQKESDEEWTKTDYMNLDLTLSLPNPAVTEKDEEAGKKTDQ